MGECGRDYFQGSFLPDFFLRSGETQERLLESAVQAGRGLPRPKNCRSRKRRLKKKPTLQVWKSITEDSEELSGLGDGN